MQHTPRHSRPSRGGHRPSVVTGRPTEPPPTGAEIQPPHFQDELNPPSSDGKRKKRAETRGNRGEKSNREKSKLVRPSFNLFGFWFPGHKATGKGQMVNCTRSVKAVLRLSAACARETVLQVQIGAHSTFHSLQTERIGCGLTVVGCAGDNASNIQGAIKNQPPHATTSLACMAHLANLMIKDMVKHFNLQLRVGSSEVVGNLCMVETKKAGWLVARQPAQCNCTMSVHGRPSGGLTGWLPKHLGWGANGGLPPITLTTNHHGWFGTPPNQGMALFLNSVV